MNHLFYPIKTKYGNVWAMPTNAKHVLVEFGSNLNVETEGPAPGQRRGPLTIRGLVIYGSAHYYRHSDGMWRIGAEADADGWVRLRSALWLRREGSTAEASDAQTRNVVAELEPLVNMWAAVNIEALRLAQRDEDIEALAKKRAQRTKLVHDLGNLDGEISALEELTK